MNEGATKTHGLAVANPAAAGSHPPPRDGDAALRRAGGTVGSQAPAHEHLAPGADPGPGADRVLWTRIGAVSYLNTRPLVYRLERSDVPVQVRFDVPSQCAALLHEGEVDLGLIPSIEYLRGADYRVVPDVAIGSEGPVASVALFSKVPIDRIASIGLDTSSRTSAALLQVLCAERFCITPAFSRSGPDLEDMIARFDAALLIGDPALFSDHERLGLAKIDLGHEWTAHTGLPFVWAFWAGRREHVTPDVCEALRVARDRGVQAYHEIAETYGGGDASRARRAETYLRENMKYGLGPREEAALTHFYDSAARLGLVPESRPIRYGARLRTSP
jgi:chorismate dehydratase